MSAAQPPDFHDAPKVSSYIMFCRYIAVSTLKLGEVTLLVRRL